MEAKTALMIRGTGEGQPEVPDDLDVGEIAIRSTVEIYPVPYSGDEQPITIERPPTNRFMLEKPA